MLEALAIERVLAHPDLQARGLPRARNLKARLETQAFDRSLAFLVQRLVEQGALPASCRSLQVSCT